MEVVRTLIADDHPIYRKGLKNILQHFRQPSFKLVGEAANGSEALQLLSGNPVDLLLLDMNMPVMDGLQLLEALAAEPERPRVVVLSMYDSPKLIRSALKHGADAYLLKDRSTNELLEAVRTVFAGETFTGEGVFLHQRNGRKQTVAKSKGQVVFRDQFLRKHSLTKRELEILHLITQAMNNKEIGKALFISDQTVSVHRKNIMRKLGVSSTAGLIKTAYDNSLV